MLIIREECPEDFPAVFDVNAKAFDTDSEARLVNALRRRVRPLISLVAERDGDVVGHVLFTPVSIDHGGAGTTMMGLAPMAVHPDVQRQGIGSKLIYAGLDACKALRTELVFVVGHAEYYPRFGFIPACEKKLHYKDGSFDSHFFVLELVKGALRGFSGEVSFHPLFDGI